MGHQYRIDVLRLTAATLVFLFHLFQFGLATPAYRAIGDDRAFGWLEPVSWFGWVGVEIFFVISGYVIAASASGATSGQFLAKRALRVFPALWVCSLIALAVRLAWGESAATALDAFGRSVVLWPKGPYIDGVIWTLVVEAAFYALVAGLLLLDRAMRIGDSLLDVGTLVLGGASTAFLLLILVAESLQLSVGEQLLREALGSFLFKVALLWHGVFFALGMLLWSIRRSGSSPLKRWACIVFGTASAFEIHVQVDGGLSGLVPVAVWGAAVAVVAWGDRLRVRLDARHANRVRQAGLLTYPLYLNHFTFGTFLVPVLALHLGSGWSLLVATVVIIWSSSWLIVRWPERHLQNWGRRLLSAPRIAAALRQT